MPPIVVPNEGQVELATSMAITADFSGYEYQFDLFSNNYTPTQSSSVEDFVIANYDGYEPKVWHRTDWNTVITIDDEAVLTLALNPLQFQNLGEDQIVYGYLIRSVSSGNVLWCQRFDLTPTIGVLYGISFSVILNVFGSYP